MQPTDDSVLLRQYAENHSDEAFATLVARHVNLVNSVAVRCVGDPHQAEEVAQAVFITLAKKAAQLRHDKALSSWLFQTTRLTASNFVRGETRRHRREQEAHLQSVLNESGSDLGPRIAPLLDDAVAGLNEKDRQAIVLRFYEDWNLREVGAALGASEDAAEKRVNRAVEKLRAFFAKRGVAVNASGLAVVLSANAVQVAPVGLAVTIATAAALGGTTLITTATATTTKAIAMTMLQKALITAAIVASVGTGIYEARQASILRAQVRSFRQQRALLTGQIQPMAGDSLAASMPLARLLTNAPAKRFNWESVESTDYKQYIANLRAIGCPEETIRDIIRADVSKLYEGKKKEVRKAAPKFEYWKGDGFLRGVGREAWIQMLAVNEERDATLRALGIEPDLSKKEAKNAAVMDWMLDFLGEEKKAQVLRIHKDLEDKLAMRELNSLDAAGIARLMQERDEAVKHLLTPEEALQYDLRLSTTALTMRNKADAFEATEQEFITLYKLLKAFEEQFPESPPVNPEDLTAAERRARREAAEEAERELQEQIKLALGPERYAEYQPAQNPIYQQMFRIAKQADLGTLDAKQLYQARLNAEEHALQIQNDQGLSPGQRDTALLGVRQETERSIMGVLGEKGWKVFKGAGNSQWLDQIHLKTGKPNTLAPTP